jgi:hypothetical protein
MRSLLLSVLLLGCAAEAAPAGYDAPAPEPPTLGAETLAEWSRFRSDRTRISLEYPSAWSIVESVPDAAAFPDPFREPIARLRLEPPGTPWGELEIATYRNPPGWTVDRWEAFYREGEEGEDHPLEELSPARLGGAEGLRLVLFEIERTTEQLVLLHSGLASIVRFDRSNPNDSDAKAHRAVHRRILESLRLP